jgi:hypothetical protein
VSFEVVGFALFILVLREIAVFGATEMYGFDVTIGCAYDGLVLFLG